MHELPTAIGDLRTPENIWDVVRQLFGCMARSEARRLLLWKEVEEVREVPCDPKNGQPMTEEQKSQLLSAWVDSRPVVQNLVDELQALAPSSAASFITNLSQMTPAQISPK